VCACANFFSVEFWEGEQKEATFVSLWTKFAAGVPFPCGFFPFFPAALLLRRRRRCFWFLLARFPFPLFGYFLAVDFSQYCIALAS